MTVSAEPSATVATQLEEARRRLAEDSIEEPRRTAESLLGL
jgi:hypothetical protein